MANRVVGGVMAIAEVASTGVEAIGTQFANGCNRLGNTFADIPFVGRLLGGVAHWLGSVVAAFFDWIAITLKASLNLIANLIEGSVHITGGSISRDKGRVALGLSDIRAGVASTGIAVGGKALALTQAMLAMQWGERPLNPREKELLWQVYRGSLRYGNVRVVDGFAGLFSVNDRQFVLGNKIYMKNTPPGAYYDKMLVHECCHVWQNQHLGTRYLFDALWAQRRLPDAYSWRAELAKGHTHWREFNKEAQASLLEDIFSKGRQIPPKGIPGEFYEDDPVGENVEFKVGGIDYTPLAREAVAYVRKNIR